MNAPGLIAVIPFAVVIASAAGNGRALPAGTWGGDHVALQVSDTGAEVEFDCAKGRIEKPIELNRDGDFDVEGTYTAEHGGPVRDDDPGAAPVRYTGTVTGETMTLTVVRNDDSVGPFTLTRGRVVNLRKCR